MRHRRRWSQIKPIRTITRRIPLGKDCMDRLARLRTMLATQQLDAILITKAENRMYLTEFTGSAGSVLVTAREALLLVDFRYVEQAAAEAPGCEVVRVPRQAADAVAEIVRRRELQRIGLEQDGLRYREYEVMSKVLHPAAFVPVDGI